MDTITVETGPLRSTEFAIVSLTGQEAVNELFEFAAVVTVPRAAVENHLHGGAEAGERLLLGARVCVALGDGGARTDRFGIVVEARYEDVTTQTAVQLAQFQLRVAPTAWLLTQQRRSRIFQKLYMHEIVSRVLGQSGVKHRWALENRYPRRVYCTQYDETDWEYVTRLLAEEGVWFYFEHAECFAPDKVPDVPEDTSKRTAGWLGVAADALKPLAGAGLGKIGDGLGVFVAGGLGIAADFETPEVEDPEATRPVVPGTGASGPPGRGDVLVFVDRPGGYVRSTQAQYDNFPLTVTRRNDGDLVADPYVVHSYAAARAIRPTQTETRDYDFRRPLVLLRSVVDHPDAVVSTAEGPLPMEVYAHHGEHETPDVDAQNARALLEQYRARATVVRSATNCPRLMPGHLFELANGTNEPLVEGQYAVLRVRHDVVGMTRPTPGGSHAAEALARGAARAVHEALTHGEQVTEADLQGYIRRAAELTRDNPRTYQNFVEYVPHGLPARPPRPRRVPRNVTESATVMGPRGQDVYMDKFGRIKVQFHWDREGPWNEGSSCWLRVTQPWSGAGYGFQFIPRVGMEVLVTFLAGDPDRPVIIGTLYNGTHETPEPLPLRKTRSAIRSQSVPDGGGFNEIAFEDEKGRERLYLHAEKDLETIVGDAHLTTVRGDDVLLVGRTQSVGVAVDQRTMVSRNQATLVGANQSASVAGNRVARVTGNETTYVEGSRLAEVAGVAMESVQGDAASVVRGARSLSTHGDYRVTVGGSKDPADARLASTFVHGTHSTVAHVVTLTAADLLDKKATSVIVLQCGESTIELHPDEIKITSKKVTVNGTDQARLQSRDATLTLEGKKAQLTADPIDLGTGKGASLHLEGSNAKVFGSAIALRPGAGGADSQSDPARDAAKNVKLAVTYGPPTDKKPLADVPYWVLLARGKTEGTTNGQGEVAFHAEPEETSATVQLFGTAALQTRYPRFFADLKDPVEFVVKIETSVPPSSGLPGARFRLRNLGYEPGAELDHVGADRSTTEALLKFQHDTGTAESGQMDDDTRTALNRAWGA